MSKTLDPNLDLDLDNISKKKIVKRSDSKNKIANTPLSIPVDGRPNKFITKTVAECTAKEFEEWANIIGFPLQLDLTSYEIERNRITHLINAISYHKENYYHNNKEALRTLH